MVRGAEQLQALIVGLPWERLEESIRSMGVCKAIDGESDYNSRRPLSPPATQIGGTSLAPRCHLRKNFLH